MDHLNAKNWTVDDVCRWLESIGKIGGKYCSDFRENDIDGEMILALEETEMEELVTKKLHRKKIWLAITKLQDSQIQWFQTTAGKTFVTNFSKLLGRHPEYIDLPAQKETGTQLLIQFGEHLTSDSEKDREFEITFPPGFPNEPAKLNGTFEITMTGLQPGAQIEGQLQPGAEAAVGESTGGETEGETEGEGEEGKVVSETFEGEVDPLTCLEGMQAGVFLQETIRMTDSLRQEEAENEMRLHLGELKRSINEYDEHKAGESKLKTFGKVAFHTALYCAPRYGEIGETFYQVSKIAKQRNVLMDLVTEHSAAVVDECVSGGCLQRGLAYLQVRGSELSESVMGSFFGKFSKTVVKGTFEAVLCMAFDMSDVSKALPANIDKNVIQERIKKSAQQYTDNIMHTTMQTALFWSGVYLVQSLWECGGVVRDMQKMSQKYNDYAKLQLQRFLAPISDEIDKCEKVIRKLLKTINTTGYDTDAVMFELNETRKKLEKQALLLDTKRRELEKDWEHVNWQKMLNIGKVVGNLGALAATVLLPVGDKSKMIQGLSAGCYGLAAVANGATAYYCHLQLKKIEKHMELVDTQFERCKNATNDISEIYTVVQARKDTSKKDD